MDDDNICLADSATTHTILKDVKYFSNLTKMKANVNTISGTSNMIEGSGRAIILLPRGTKFIIDDALLSTKSKRNLLSFKDIPRNRYHIETMNKDNIEYLQITNIICGSKSMLEELPALSIGLYYTRINTIEAHHAIMKSEFNNSQNNFVVWHERVGHPGAIMM